MKRQCENLECWTGRRGRRQGLAFRSFSCDTCPGRGNRTRQTEERNESGVWCVLCCVVCGVCWARVKGRMRRTDQGTKWRGSGDGTDRQTRTENRRSERNTQAQRTLLTLTSICSLSCTL